jgi:hypothetical protein
MHHIKSVPHYQLILLPKTRDTESFLLYGSFSISSVVGKFTDICSILYLYLAKSFKNAHFELSLIAVVVPRELAFALELSVAPHASVDSG